MAVVMSESVGSVVDVDVAAGDDKEVGMCCEAGTSGMGCSTGRLGSVASAEDVVDEVRSRPLAGVAAGTWMAVVTWFSIDRRAT